MQTEDNEVYVTGILPLCPTQNCLTNKAYTQQINVIISNSLYSLGQLCSVTKSGCLATEPISNRWD